MGPVVWFWTTGPKTLLGKPGGPDKAKKWTKLPPNQANNSPNLLFLMSRLLNRQMTGDAVTES